MALPDLISRKAAQSAATDQAPDTFLLSPAKSAVPQHSSAGAAGGRSNRLLRYRRQPDPGSAIRKRIDRELLSVFDLRRHRITSKTPDTRITNVNSLPPGPFQLTNGTTFTYNSYAASPVHRFYQMWQQLDCNAANATCENPSGCDAGLFPWVEVTVGAGTNGVATAVDLQHRIFGRPVRPPAKARRPWDSTMSRMATLPTSRCSPTTYAMSDNFHQSVNGRHRREPHHAGPRRCDLVQRWQW